MQLLLRFLIGGAVVSLFAVIGDVVRPKSFAGLFGAAPSVALATLALAIHAEGIEYAATEARSMMLGAFASLVYAWVASRILWRGPRSVPVATIASLIVWMGIAVGGWLITLRGAR
jgi:hypothetical protein